MMRFAFVWFSSLCLAAAAIASPPGPAPDRIEVNPTEVLLQSHRAVRQLVVTGYFSGEARDLTTQAAFVSADPKIVAVERTQAVPVADGQTAITVSVGGQSATITATVSNFATPDPVQFKFETVAVLTKQGCATGSCHGSPHGKGNFSLSLFGYDPAIDQVSLTRDGFNRRVNVMEPGESLMLKKPLMQLSHVGGKRLQKNDAAYRILYDWIFEGADASLPAVDCLNIVVYPKSNRVLKAPFLQQQISVLANYSDGSVRDVTALATFTSSSASVAEPNAGGLVTGKSRGQAAVSIRYLDKLESVLFTVIEDIPGFAWKTAPENNFIDHLVDEKLRQLQYLPSDICTDEVFVRRLSLDLTGLLPTPDRVKTFLGDTAVDKRSKLIDEFLATEEHARFWAQKKAELMRVSPKSLKDGRAELFADWIIDAQRKNVPYDQFARQLLTARGSTRDVPAGNYFQAIATTEERTEMTAEIFMGSRLQCSKCHNHPFENWTMRDYYSLAAVFCRTQEENGVVTLLDSGEASVPTTHQTMMPWGSPRAATSTTIGKSDRREIFANWLTAKGNPYFARVEVNRIWAQLLGRGIVDPVDDFRSSNPPSNAPLLDGLADEFERSGFDRRHMIRLICNSRTYQRSTQTTEFNASDDTLFSHATARLLTAEQLTDAIGMVGGSLESMPVLTGHLAETQKSRDARIAEIERGYDEWLIDAAEQAQSIGSWSGAWFSAGPFTFKGDPFGQTFAPEAHKVNVVDTFDDGRVAWRLRLDIKDARQKLELTKDSVNFYARRIHSTAARTVKVKIKAGDGATVWLNEERITPKPISGEKEISLNLIEGENRLLLKVINRGDAQFDYQPAFHDDRPVNKGANVGDLPGAIVDLLTTPADTAPKNFARAVHDWHVLDDRKLHDLQERVSNYENRIAYSTQRTLPNTSAFLTAFGQPVRQSACTCDRSSTPTLLQSLELLNGATVSGMIGSSSGRYGPLQPNAIIDELYLAAFSRLPTDKDRENAGKYLKGKADRSKAVIDLVWAIVNTQEFLFQH